MQISNRSQFLFMAIYSKESLEELRHKIDLGQVISSYVPLQKSGASYKGLCPFHDEKTPSFMIHKGDSHYHCFGCGAHGDAISFLMEHAKMTFVEAIEFLAEKFQVSLEKVEEEGKGPDKKRLKQLLAQATSFYRFFLFHAEEGKLALEYLYKRGIDKPFLEKFEIGYAPKQGDMLYKLLSSEKFSEEEMVLAGLVHKGGMKGRKDFFTERIMFPIRDRMGAVIGFSGRKFQEETFGGKYVNTPETPLFKKSHVLFGLCYSRYRIAKERKALIVEGQIDALRLIHEGWDFTVAGQGTAFGEGHVKELLHLGVERVYLAFDGDPAGQEAAAKVGDLFQSKGVEVFLLSLPSGADPDSFLRENGKEAFSQLMEHPMDYLSFYYRHLAVSRDMSSPSRKAEVVELMASRIRKWEHPVLIHESLKRLADIAEVPSELLGHVSSPLQQMKRVTLSATVVQADKVLEMDLLRWLFLSPDPDSFSMKVIQKNLVKEDFKVPACASLFETYLGLSFEERREWFSLATYLREKEEQEIFNELLVKKVNKQKIEQCVPETVKKILERNWMEKKEKILHKMKNHVGSEEDLLSLTQEFGMLCKTPPRVLIYET